MLLPYLDAESTKNLAKAHGLTLKILGKAFAWDKLVNRAFPLDVESGIVRDDVSLAGFLSEIVSMAKSSKLPRQDINWGGDGILMSTLGFMSTAPASRFTMFLSWAF